MKCYNCDKNALYLVGPNDQKIPLCLDCYVKFQNVHAQQTAEHEREINYLTAQMESTVGLPGILPRYPERGQPISMKGVTLNNIHISKSHVGVINTGTIESVDATITVLKQSGSQEIADHLTRLTKKVVASNDVTNKAKNEVLEMLSVIGSEAVAPKERRRGAVVKAMIKELSLLLGRVVALNKLWEQAKSAFEVFFN